MNASLGIIVPPAPPVKWQCTCSRLMFAKPVARSFSNRFSTFVSSLSSHVPTHRKVSLRGATFFHFAQSSSEPVARITCSWTPSVSRAICEKSTFLTSRYTRRFGSFFSAAQISARLTIRCPACSGPRNAPISSFFASSYVRSSSRFFFISSEAFGSIRAKLLSWNIITRPSFVVRTSTSGMQPMLHESSSAPIVFSGARKPAPRCATTDTRSSGICRMLQTGSAASADAVAADSAAAAHAATQPFSNGKRFMSSALSSEDIEGGFSGGVTGYFAASARLPIARISSICAIDSKPMTMASTQSSPSTYFSDSSRRSAILPSPSIFMPVMPLPAA